MEATHTTQTPNNKRSETVSHNTNTNTTNTNTNTTNNNINTNGADWPENWRAEDRAAWYEVLGDLHRERGTRPADVPRADYGLVCRAANETIGMLIRRGRGSSWDADNSMEYPWCSLRAIAGAFRTGNLDLPW